VWLSIAELEAQPGLLHGFSTLALGSMRSSDDGWLTPPRRALCAALGVDPQRLSVIGAEHGARVQRVDVPRGVVAHCDVLVTDRPGLPLLGTFADCYPLLLFDPGRRVLALAHAGWRGTTAGVAAAAVQALVAEYGCRPSDLVAGLGPGICGTCYEVGSDVAVRFDPAVVSRREGRYFLDLGAALRRQLETAGVGAAVIHVHPACTRETPELASHRRCPDGTRFACIAAIRW
jgi:YfiH family protein